MKKIVFLALASMLVIGACKKKKSEPAPSSGSTTPPPTSTFTDHNGLLRVYNIYSKTLGSASAAQLNFRSGSEQYDCSEAKKRESPNT